MNIAFLLKGIVIGFSIAAPVGPIGILCIRRTLAEGRAAGFFSGLGAATADAIYGCIAGFGLTFISQFLVDQQNWLRIIGGIFLLYLGNKIFLAKGSEETAQSTENGLINAYFSTFFLTLTNPMTIISFAAIFAGLGIVNTSGNYNSAMLLVLGVFIGSMAWWLLLSGGAGILQKKINANGLAWINRISGAIITGFGIIAITSLLFQQ